MKRAFPIHANPLTRQEYSFFGFRERRHGDSEMLGFALCERGPVGECLTAENAEGTENIRLARNEGMADVALFYSLAAL